MAPEAEQIFRKVFGPDGSNAPQVRAAFAEALGRFERQSVSPIITGFEFRRFVRERLNTEFEAFRYLNRLDLLFRHLRLLGLPPSEYEPIEDRWLEAITPRRITREELKEAIFPTRFR